MLPTTRLHLMVVRLLREVSPIHLLFVGRDHERTLDASGALIASAAVTAHALLTYRRLFRVGVDTAI